MGTHLEASLQRDIAVIRERTLAMATRCEDALRAALRAFVEGERQTAYFVILRDRHVDQLERELDRLCLEFLVRQQPAGQHLRFVYAAFKINGELERVGDYAESIARQALKLNHRELHMSFGAFEREADLAVRMLHDAVRAFVDANEGLARATMSVEDQIDELRREIDGELVRMSQEGRLPVGALTPLMTISRRFERTSDQAKNICAQVLYMCTGEYTRHQGAGAFRILFLDRSHGVLSRLAEALLRALGKPQLQPSSAGLHPLPPDPRLAAYLSAKGLANGAPIAPPTPMPGNFNDYQVIVALDEEARAVLPRGSTSTVGFFWAPPPRAPAAAESHGTGERDDFEADYVHLKTQIEDLAAAIMGEGRTTLP